MNDAREFTAFEHILKKFCFPGWKVKNEKSDLDGAREISAFLTYFKENHTVVIGKKYNKRAIPRNLFIKYALYSYLSIIAKIYYVP